MKTINLRNKSWPMWIMKNEHHTKSFFFRVCTPLAFFYICSEYWQLDWFIAMFTRRIRDTVDRKNENEFVCIECFSFLNILSLFFYIKICLISILLWNMLNAQHVRKREKKIWKKILWTITNCCCFTNW